MLNVKHVKKTSFTLREGVYHSVPQDTPTARTNLSVSHVHMVVTRVLNMLESAKTAARVGSAPVRANVCKRTVTCVSLASTGVMAHVLHVTPSARLVLDLRIWTASHVILITSNISPHVWTYVLWAHILHHMVTCASLALTHVPSVLSPAAKHANHNIFYK